MEPVLLGEIVARYGDSRCGSVSVAVGCILLRVMLLTLCVIVGLRAGTTLETW